MYDRSNLSQVKDQFDISNSNKRAIQIRLRCATFDKASSINMINR